MTLLIACAVLYGAVAGLVFRRLTDSAKLRTSVNRLIAHIIEFRLFIDEPALIWRAQKDALRANGALLGQVVWPCLLMALPLALAWSPMQERFGHGPLKIGEATVMTAHTEDVPCMTGLLVESPGVRIARTGEVMWRVRPIRELKGPLPAGVELRYPTSNTWIVWFLAISSFSAVVFARTI
jgi:hypothetical protein